MAQLDETKSKQPVTETDPRFPSGEWKGFWLQRGLPGRQWMTLALQFVHGRISGEGRDIIGEFVLRGRYSLEDGRCHIIKAYVERHDVVYSGYNDGDGLWLWGTWRLPRETGGFHLWPKGEEDPTGSTLKEEADLPAEMEVAAVAEPAGKAD